MPNYEKIIPGLDALIGEPEILTPEKDTPRKFECIGIPDSYIQHVDKFYQEQSGRGDACRKLMQIFNEVLTYNFQNQTEIYTAANGMKIEFIDTGEDNHHSAIKLKPNGSQAQAINTAKSLSEKNKNSVAIMTGSDKLSALASLRGIDVVHINPEVYTGRRQVPLSLDNATNLWYSNKRITAEEWEEYFPDQEPLRHNEFVEFTVESFGQVDHRFANVGRYDANEKILMPLKYTDIGNAPFDKIHPRNAGQAMLLEALLAPPEEIPIVIVSGVFGTGKTFLATAVGYIKAREGLYERVFVCPRDGALGEQIGFVPGDTTEKTRVKAKPIEDNLREVLKLNRDEDNKDNCSLTKRVEKEFDEYFVFEPIINMGGRSLSNTFIILDEFQDTERHQAKALLSRIGEGSKIVVLGDPTQNTNPHINRTSNGLSYSASRLAGKPEAAIITLNKGEIIRSSAARAIAKYFD